jgi:hypothetical protein
MSKTCSSCDQGYHERCRDTWCDCCGTDSPSMTEVFHIKEGPMPERPPPGSKPVKPDAWKKLGMAGQNAQKSLDALGMAGGEPMDAFVVPDGDVMAFPKTPGQGSPVKADLMKGGLWTPMTGSTGGTTMGNM